MNNNKQHQTAAAWLRAEYRDAIALKRSNPMLFWIGFLVVVGLALLSGYDHFWGIPQLNKIIDKKNTELLDMQQKIAIAETQLAPVKTAAILKYGAADAKAMALIAEDMRQFEAALRMIENKIRTLSVVVEVEYLAKWKENNIPDPSKWIRLNGSGGEVKVDLKSRDNKVYNIQFDGSSGVQINNIDGGYVRMRYRVDAVPGQTIFGQLPEEFYELNKFVFYVYGTQPEHLASDKVFIRKISAVFVINGRPKLFMEKDVNETAESRGNGLWPELAKPLPLRYDPK